MTAALLCEYTTPLVRLKKLVQRYRFFVAVLLTVLHVVLLIFVSVVLSSHFHDTHAQLARRQGVVQQWDQYHRRAPLQLSEPVLFN